MQRLPRALRPFLPWKRKADTTTLVVYHPLKMRTAIFATETSVGVTIWNSIGYDTIPMESRNTGAKSRNARGSFM